MDAHELGIYAGDGGGLKITSQTDTVRAPDFSFIRRERIRDAGTGCYPGAPDLAVEVLPPTNRFSIVLTKVRQYLAAGCRLVWVADLKDRSVVVFRVDGSTTLLGEHDTLGGEDVLPEFIVQLRDIRVN